MQTEWAGFKTKICRLCALERRICSHHPQSAFGLRQNYWNLFQTCKSPPATSLQINQHYFNSRWKFQITEKVKKCVCVISDLETAGGLRPLWTGCEADAVSGDMVGVLEARRRVLRRRAGVRPLDPVPVVPLGAVPLGRVVPPHPGLRHCENYNTSNLNFSIGKNFS